MSKRFLRRLTDLVQGRGRAGARKNGRPTLRPVRPAKEETLEALEGELVAPKPTPEVPPWREAHAAGAPVGDAVAGQGDVPAATDRSTTDAEAATGSGSRRALISEALGIRRAKAQVLNELDASDRRRLRALAEAVLLGRRGRERGKG